MREIGISSNPQELQRVSKGLQRGAPGHSYAEVINIETSTGLTAHHYLYALRNTLDLPVLVGLLMAAKANNWGYASKSKLGFNNLIPFDPVDKHSPCSVKS